MKKVKQTKQCKKCGEMKPHDEYYKNMAYRDRLAQLCIPCYLAASKARRRRRAPLHLNQELLNTTTFPLTFTSKDEVIFWYKRHITIEDKRSAIALIESHV